MGDDIRVCLYAEAAQDPFLVGSRCSSISPADSSASILDMAGSSLQAGMPARQSRHTAIASSTIPNRDRPL